MWGNLLITISGGRVTAKYKESWHGVIVITIAWSLNLRMICFGLNGKSPRLQVFLTLLMIQGSRESRKLYQCRKLCSHSILETIQVRICTRNIKNWRDKTDNLSFFRKITYIKPHELETLLWMGRRRDVWKGLSYSTWFSRTSHLSETSSCRNSCNANTTCSKVCGCYSVRYLVLYLLLIKFGVLRWLLHWQIYKCQQKLDWKSYFPWLDYGFHKCIRVDSLIKYIGPLNCAHYWLWSW